MSFIATVVLILVIGDLAWWWRAHRMLRRAQPFQAALALFSIAQLCGLALILASRSQGVVLDALLSPPLLAVVYIWHLLVLIPTLIIWLGADAVRGVSALVRRLTQRGTPPTSGMSRREFLGSVAALTPAALSIGGASVAIPQISQFRVRPIELPLAALPPALDGLTIAHVTDTHVGRFTQGKVLDAIVRATNELNADLVLMTGDLINYALSDLPVALDLVLQFRSRHGTYMCEGNHDLIENADTFVRETRAAGIPLLIGESQLLDIRGARLQLLGLPWGAPEAGPSRAEQHGDAAIAFSTRRLLAQRRDDAFPILLAHHPHAFDFAEKIPLTLSGHTHGGQLMFSEHTGFGPWLFRYWSGLSTKAGRALVVSNGVGNWFPLRTNAPAEIIHLTLRTARS